MDMNNQVKITDTQKLLDWIAVNEKEYYDTKDVFNALERAIESGVLAFDTPPVPTIKPGDKVRHKEYDIGIVIDEYKGKTVADFDDGLLEVNTADLEVVE